MIHLLNTRSSIFFDVLQRSFRLDSIELNKEINFMFNNTVKAIKAKKIDYGKLKNTLLPAHKGYKEYVFIFDSTKIESNWYGLEVFRKLFSSIKHDNTLSFLFGDIISRSLNQRKLAEIIFENVKFFHPTTFQCSEQYFVIYINHISNDQINDIESSLVNYEPFIGSVDATFHSRLKLLLSLCLSSLCIKYKDKVILPHESDRDDSENVNLVGYPYEDYGFKLYSVNEVSYGLFLSFRIDSVYIGEHDQEFSLSAIAHGSLPLSECDVIVPQAKLEYLKNAKGDILRRLGLYECSADEMAEIIKKKFSQAHLYNLKYSQEYMTSTFNIFIESKTVDGAYAKTMISLKYLPDVGAVQIVTLY